MAKVLYLPLAYGWVDQQGTKDAFLQAGQNLLSFDYYDFYEKHNKDRPLTCRELLKLVDSFRPDLIYAQIQHTDILTGQVFATIKSKYPKTIIANYTIDVRNHVPLTYLDIGRQADYNFISSTGQISIFEQALKKKVQFLQIGYDPSLYHPALKQPDAFEFDCVFIATNNPREGYPGVVERERACRLLKREFGNRFALFGAHWPNDLGSKGVVDQRKVAEIYQKSVCCLSISHYNDLNHYFSDRLLMCLASGRPTVCYRFPHWESYFTDRSDLLIANSIEEIPNKIRSLKNDPVWANWIGEMGATKVAAEHTYLSRIIELLNIVGLS